MRRTTKAAALAATAAAALLLAGCADPVNEPSSVLVDNEGPGTMSARTVNMEDGRVVFCAVWKSGNAGGISCDWAGATAPSDTSPTSTGD